jgi:predicted RNA binding protein YcfA (HicA-like mRNA interferase family)
MPRLPRVTARRIVAVLERSGFSLAKRSGSHVIYKNADGKRVTIPCHASKTLHPKVLKSILPDADLAVEQLEDLPGLYVQAGTECSYLFVGLRTTDSPAAIAMRRVRRRINQVPKEW